MTAELTQKEAQLDDTTQAAEKKKAGTEIPASADQGRQLRQR